MQTMESKQSDDIAPAGLGQHTSLRLGEAERKDDQAYNAFDQLRDKFIDRNELDRFSTWYHSKLVQLVSQFKDSIADRYFEVKGVDKQQATTGEALAKANLTQVLTYISDQKGLHEAYNKLFVPDDSQPFSTYLRPPVWQGRKDPNDEPETIPEVVSFVYEAIFKIDANLASAISLVAENKQDDEGNGRRASVVTVASEQPRGPAPSAASASAETNPNSKWALGRYINQKIDSLTKRDFVLYLAAFIFLLAAELAVFYFTGYIDGGMWENLAKLFPYLTEANTLNAWISAVTYALIGPIVLKKISDWISTAWNTLRDWVLSPIQKWFDDHRRAALFATTVYRLLQLGAAVGLFILALYVFPPAAVFVAGLYVQSLIRIFQSNGNQPIVKADSGPEILVKPEAIAAPASIAPSQNLRPQLTKGIIQDRLQGILNRMRAASDYSELQRELHELKDQLPEEDPLYNEQITLISILTSHTTTIRGQFTELEGIMAPLSSAEQILVENTAAGLLEIYQYVYATPIAASLAALEELEQPINALGEIAKARIYYTTVDNDHLGISSIYHQFKSVRDKIFERQAQEMAHQLSELPQTVYTHPREFFPTLKAAKALSKNTDFEKYHIHKGLNCGRLGCEYTTLPENMSGRTLAQMVEVIKPRIERFLSREQQQEIYPQATVTRHSGEDESSAARGESPTAFGASTARRRFLDKATREDPADFRRELTTPVETDRPVSDKIANMMASSPSPHHMLLASS